MRLANHAGRAVLVTGDDRAVDVAEASGGRFGPDPAALSDDWDAFRAWAAEAPLDRAPAHPIDEAALGPPSPRPRQVFGIGLNYRAHAAETGQEVPRIPATFTKFPSCLTGPYAPVGLPSGHVDWAGELVVVVGRRAPRVPAGQPWARGAGRTVGA